MEAVRAGVDWLQVREKDLDARALVELVRPLVESAQGGNTRVVVNDRLDVALAVGAAGVHLGAQSLPPQAVRARVPPDFFIGVSCHSVQDAVAAEAAGADYLLFGPVFETPSKAVYGPPQGLSRLKEVTAAVKTPVLALGGISTERVRSCLEAGASGVAGIRLFQECGSIEACVRGLRALVIRDENPPR